MCSKRTFSTTIRPGKVFFSLKELRKLLESENSCVSVVNCRRTITITPVHLKDLATSVKELLSSKVTNFDVELQGVILGHKNVKIISSSLQFSDSRNIPLEYIADIYVFKPEIGSKLTGVVNKIAPNKEYVSVLVHNIFNVAVYSSYDQLKPTVYMGSAVTVTVTLINFAGRLPFIKGKIVSSNSETTNEKERLSDEGADNDQEFESASIRIQPIPVTSILKNSPSRIQSSTEAESSSAESDVKKRKSIETPKIDEIRERKKKKKQKDRGKDEINREKNGLPSKKRKRDEEGAIEGRASPSKKMKRKDKKHNQEDGTVGTGIDNSLNLLSENNPLDSTMQLLPDASIFKAASSTPVLGPPSTKKKKKKNMSEKSEAIEPIKMEPPSAIQLAIMEVESDMALGGREKKSSSLKKLEQKIARSKSNGCDVKSSKDGSSSVETDSQASSKGKKKKKGKKKEKNYDSLNDECMDIMRQALRNLKDEVDG